MNRSVRQKLYLTRKDLFAFIGDHASSFLYSAIIASIGVAVGVYIGIKVGEKETPFCIFAELFRLQYAPFGRLFTDFLRFLLYALLVVLAYFLPMPILYPTIALLLFGKHFGQSICLAFLTDSVLASVLSLCLIALPLLLVGTILLTFLTLRASEYRLCGSGGCDRHGTVGILRSLAVSLAIYATLLLILYIPLCGSIYLIAIAV